MDEVGTTPQLIYFCCRVCENILDSSTIDEKHNCANKDEERRELGRKDAAWKCSSNRKTTPKEDEGYVVAVSAFY